jgi:hypothetical protein
VGRRRRWLADCVGEEGAQLSISLESMERAFDLGDRVAYQGIPDEALDDRASTGRKDVRDH